MEKQKQEAQLKAAAATAAGPDARRSRRQPGSPARPAQPGQPGAAPPLPGQRAPAVPGQQLTREAVLAASPRVAIETPRLQGSIALKGGRIDDLALIQYRETVDPKSPPIVLLSPSGSPHPFYAEFGWVGGAGAHGRSCPDADTVWTPAGRRRARRRQAGHADLGQRRRPGVPPHHRGRRQVPVHRRGRGRQQGRRAGHALSLRADLAPRHAEDRRLLHPARRPDRRARRARACRKSPTATIEDKKNDLVQGDQRLARHHRQVLGGDAAARHQGARCRRASPPAPSARTKTYQTDYLLDAQTIAPGATGTANARLFAGAKEVAVVDGYDKAARPQPLRAADRLGLVLLHHQADVHGRSTGSIQLRRQFRPRDPARHRADQDRLLPARQQVLRLDGEDEGGAAGDDGDPRALRATTR